MKKEVKKIYKLKRGWLPKSHKIETPKTVYNRKKKHKKEAENAEYKN